MKNETSSKNRGLLKICLLSYRSNPHSGGQGIYIKRLSRALRDLGHTVDVVSGPPYPKLDTDIPVFNIPGLDLYNPENMFRMPTFRELCDPVNFVEWVGVSTMGFPEPYTFGLRARKFLGDKYQNYDLVHDNQSLSYGLLTMRSHIPTIATIHHPITVDRKFDIESVRTPWKKLKRMRWYSFIGMQKKVSRQLSHIITVSECSKNDISRDFNVSKKNIRIVSNGIDTDLFFPIPDIKREKNQLIVTNSADAPLKGLEHLLRAVAKVSKTHAVKLRIIGTPKKNGFTIRLIKELQIGELVTFTGRVTNKRFVQEYARSSIAVVPSLYEGFGLPSGEAMACGLPVISTTGGALPEVVGDSGILVPPADSEALARAIIDLLDNPQRAKVLGRSGLKRVQTLFTWEKTAQKTVAVYREAIRDHRRFQ
ncbi:MAG: glycosyltransferase family 4 protein [Proteobacteria bacterium]|nr:glycosyltransferase family 4 protein [Pseudomonadota bacterium]